MQLKDEEIMASDTTTRADSNSNSNSEYQGNSESDNGKDLSKNITTQIPAANMTSKENTGGRTPAEEAGYLARVDNVKGLDDDSPRGKIVWRNVIIFAYVHMAALYAVVMIITGKIRWQTMVFAWVLHLLGGLGITAGAHRCYSHKSYKAKTPLKLLLVFMQTLAFQNSMWEWVRDHRVHHKYSETNADPHNAKRGFFFAHIGWLLCRKHDLVRVRGKNIDLSDIESDRVLMFQKKYHLPIGILICFVLPTYLPNKLWGESLLGGFLVAAIFRYAFTLNMTWLVNSAAHMWGPKPYDKTINPAENRMVALWAFGEGWHNYHHTFPWDYKTAELGHYRYNMTTAFVDLFAAIGWAYDLKTVPKKIVEQRVQRTGDGSRSNHEHAHREGAPWGWGDKDIPVEDAKVTQTLFPKKDD